METCEEVQAIFGDDIQVHREEPLHVTVILRHEGSSVGYVSFDVASADAITSLHADGLGRDVLASARADATRCLTGGGGIFAAVSVLQDAISTALSAAQATTSAASAASVAPRLRRVLLHLDHMRQPGPYTATITAWAAQLHLRGWLLFAGCSTPRPLILILLCGDAACISEYLKRHRTEIVDVDSTGRPCKERMLSVLLDDAPADEPAADAASDSGFQVMRLDKHADAASLLVAAGLSADILTDLLHSRSR